MRRTLTTPSIGAWASSIWKAASQENNAGSLGRHEEVPRDPIPSLARDNLTPARQLTFHELETVMKRTWKLVLPIVAGLILSTNLSRPAHAQFGGGSGGGFEQMQQMAPMLNMMKKKLGKKRFAKLMQTMGPMMSKMMDGQGGGFGGMGGGFGGGMGGFDMNSMGAMMNPEMMSMMMGMIGSGGHGRGGFGF
jgi:hypothetical protein